LSEQGLAALHALTALLRSASARHLSTVSLVISEAGCPGSPNALGILAARKKRSACVPAAECVE
jgi:hypothetical protein